MKNISESAFSIYKPIVEDICSRKTVSENQALLICIKSNFSDQRNTFRGDIVECITILCLPANLTGIVGGNYRKAGPRQTTHSKPYKLSSA